LEEITPAGATVAGPVTAFNGSATFFYPEGIAVDSPGNVYVADYENKKVELFNSLGTWQETFASAQLAGSFDEGIAVNNAGTFTFLAFSVAAGSFDSNGNLWVADHTNGRVVKYNAAGVYQSAVTLQGTAPYAVDVAVDPSGNIFATENHNNTLQEFNAAGQWLYTVTGTVAAPRGLSLDPTRTYLYVADNGSNQIVRFKIH
jgi:DNA-binding beta-propeller fold protein YncE